LHVEERLRPCCFTVKFHVAPGGRLLFHRHVGRGTSTLRHTCRSGRGLGSGAKAGSGAGEEPQARRRPPTVTRGAISARGRDSARRETVCAGGGAPLRRGASTQAAAAPLR